MPAQPTATLPRATPSASARPEWIREAVLVLLVIAAGIGLRLAYPSQMAVEHFDEGVYASNRWFGEREDYQYPNRYLYAPPLLPALIEWSFVLFGPSNFAAILPSLVAGCLTIPLAWWNMRCWAGPTVALSAAILVATSNLLIAFSRAALTDSLLVFWMVAAIGLGAHAFLKRSWLAAIGTGLLVGLAWWTKYNGWLPLAILGSAALAWEIGKWWSWPNLIFVELPQPVPARPWRDVLNTLGLFLLMAVVAESVWYPYTRSLKDVGGYAAVAANHSRYFVGWSGWWNSFDVQFVNIETFAGWTGTVGAAIALLLPLVLDWRRGERSTWNPWAVSLYAAWSLCIAGLMTYPSVLVFVSGSAMLVIFVKQWWWSRDELDPYGLLYKLTLSAWFCGMVMAVPLYTPYLRLVLPGFAVGLLLTSLILNRVRFAVSRRGRLLLGKVLDETERPPTIRAKTLGIVQVLVAGYFGVDLLWLMAAAPPAPEYQSRTAYAEAAPAMLDAVSKDLRPGRGPLPEFAIYTYGEPAMLFQLRLAGAANVVPVQHLKFAEPEAPPPVVPSYVVTGLHAGRTADFPAQFERAKGRLVLVKKVPLQLSDIVKRDHQVEEVSDEAEPELSLWRVK